MRTKTTYHKVPEGHYYAVIVDGNNHGLQTKFYTSKKQITLEKCQEICKKIAQKTKYNPGKLEILMTEFGEADDDGYRPVIGKKREACYNAATNSLVIYEDNLPIYANDNHVVCTDQDALCDCLL